MNIQEYADTLNLQLKLIYYPNQDCRWSASFEEVETKMDAASGMLESTYGNGASPDEAIADYVKQIRGRLLVVNAMSSAQRREYVVPSSLQPRRLGI